MFVIFVNCVILAMYNPLDENCTETRCRVLENVEHFVFAFFCAEIVIKMVAMGVTGNRGYLQDKWNRLDCLIVMIGLIEKVISNNNYLTIIRAFRVLRPLRAINKVPSIRILVTLLLDTLPMLGNVLLLSFLIFFVFGIISVQLWQGKLRNRCFTNFPENSTFFTRSTFYKPSFDEPDFVCSLPEDGGTSRCSNISPKDTNCSGSFEDNSINWNKCYNICKEVGPNPFYDLVSFDNIGIAWIVIFQVITLEGWSDIMYFVQDAHSSLSWIYFVVLIVVGSFFLVNLCLVVITMQFQETKAREIELIESTKDEAQPNSSEPLRAVMKFAKNLCWCRTEDEPQVHHHHHHHFYHHHHFHHHMYNCYQPASPGIFHSTSTNEPSFVFPSSDIPDIQVGGDAAMAFPSNAEHCEINPDFLAPPDRVSRRNSRTSICSHTLSIHSETYLLKHRRLSQPAHLIEMNSSPQSANVSSYSPSEMLDQNMSCIDFNQNERNRDQSEIEKVLSCADISISEFPLKTQGSDNQTKVTSSKPKKYPQIQRGARTQSEDDMFDSLFNLRQSASYDVTARRGAWQSLRALCRKVAASKHFTFFIMVVILLNMICMAPEHYDQPEFLTDAMEITNKIFVCIFSFEMVIKLLGDGIAMYLSSGQNVFDGIIVIVSVCEILLSRQTSALSVFRSIRLLRIFKLVRPVRYQLLVVIKTMTSVMTFFGLLFLFIFAFAILGMNLFGGKFEFPNKEGKSVTSRSNFDSFLWAMVSVFQILTQENWNLVMYDGMRTTNKWAALYFTALMAIGYYVLFNLLVAILVEGFTNTGSALSVFRSIRLLRIFKLVRPVRYQLLVVIKTMTSVMTFFGLLFLFIFAFAILGMNLFGGKFEFPNKEGKSVTSRSNFDSFLWAMVSVFQILTQENWNLVMYDGMRTTNKWAALYFTALMAIGYYVLFNLLVAILVEGFTNTGEPKQTPKTEEQKGQNSNAGKKDTPKISKTFYGSQNCCPGGYYHDDLPEFCGHGLRNALGIMKKKRNLYVDIFLELKNETKKRQWAKFTVTRQNWSLYLFAPSNRFRCRMASVCEHKYFDYVVLMFILISCIVLAMEEPNILPKKRQIIDATMLLLTVIFTCEMMMKDVTPSVLCLLTSFHHRMIRRAPGLKLVVQTLLYSLKPIGNTVLIAAIFFVMFGILGVQIFKGKFHYCKGNDNVTNKAECEQGGNKWENRMYNFDNLAQALISLFVFSTRDGWVKIMHNGIDAVGIDQQPITNYAEWRLVYFIPFLMLGGFLVLNMIVGVVVENFQRCRERLEDEEKQKKRKKLLGKVKTEKQEDDKRNYSEGYSKWRLRILGICLHPYWDVSIAIVILVNVICMSLEHYQMPKSLEVFVEIANYFFTGVFVLEVVVKFIAFGFARYFSDRWNLVDLVIVVLSLAGIIIESLNSARNVLKIMINPTVARSLRVLRFIRVLKLVKLAKGVRSLLDTLFEALPQVANLGLLFLLLFFIYSCLGIQLFGNLKCCPSHPCQGLGPHAHFRDFGTAMLTLFRIATGDNWNGILEDTLRCSSEDKCEEYCCVSKYTAPLFFFTFVLAAQFVLVNVVIAVLMKHLKESKEKIAANMAVKDLEKKLKLLTLSAKNFIKAKARRSDPVTTSRRQSIVQLGLSGIELVQLRQSEAPETVKESGFCTDLARADAIFQEFLRLNDNLRMVKMTIVRTSSHNTEQITPTPVTPYPRQRRNTLSGIRELHKTSSNLKKYTVYKSGTEL
ncbi:PREDICTED: voltage-dependent T-type calcium channel subunit alpha-1H-like [Acropora digitifera]|uniref:voltage-dependent T-type calcium channel subunit alpha-1H-like n=1 Tax=Acropora digitifera TaxID=70779 RepID=UPI00077AD16A|nr:PREDICTED: voltage-dependent T-type calcium channel subunit alpha-1H-like [Acropora digitifera]